MGAFVAAHFGLKIALELPRVVNFAAVFPKSNGQTRKISCPKGRRFQDSRSNNGHTQDISLELHQQIVGRGPAIDAKLVEHETRIGLHDVENVSDLESDP